MKPEINDEILKFKARWKHHNLSVIMGFLVFLLLLFMGVLIFYTVIFHNSDNKLLCIIVELFMWIAIKKLHMNIMPNKETRRLYMVEYHQLNEKIHIMVKSEIDSTLNKLIQGFKKEEK